MSLQQYLLVRPSPSLRIIFVSPALRIPGLLQSNLLSHIGGPSQVRDGLCDAFSTGDAVTAKITWLPRARQHIDGDLNSYNKEGVKEGRKSHANGSPSTRPDPDDILEEGRPRWISCTPLFGSDGRVGVWMVVMVENERISGSLPSRGRRAPEVRNIVGSERDRDSREEDTRKRRSDRIGEKGNGGVAAVGSSESGMWFAGYPGQEVPPGRRSDDTGSESEGSQRGMTP